MIYSTESTDSWDKPNVDGSGWQQVTDGEAKLRETMNAAAGSEALEVKEIKRGNVKHGGQSEREREKRRRCRRRKGGGGGQRLRCKIRKKIEKGRGRNDDIEVAEMRNEEEEQKGKGKGRGRRGFDDAEE
ncbi:hypothetical protein ACLOJK_026802, partial [Asimina triloba]